MITEEHSYLSLYDFSNHSTNIKFDHINISKPISALTLSDLIWCLRKRTYPEQIIEIVLDKIKDNWNKIDQYYGAEISEWYEDVMKEIITIPFVFWDTKHAIHKAFCDYLSLENKRKFNIEKSIIKSFISYKPQAITWTQKDSDLFEWNISIGLTMGIAGNIIEAQRIITTLKVAILNDQSVFIESEFCSISTDDELMNYITKEYSSYGDIIREIKECIIKETKVKTVANIMPA